MISLAFPALLQEHYEAVMRRTLERSQRVEQRQKRWSWGGLSTDAEGRTGTDAFLHVLLWIHQIHLLSNGVKME